MKLFRYRAKSRVLRNFPLQHSSPVISSVLTDGSPEVGHAAPLQDRPR